MLYPLNRHRAHDVAALLAAWRELMVGLQAEEITLGEAGDWPITAWSLQRDDLRTIYLSSGVHGDEAGSAWGLLEWARAHRAMLESGSWMLVPVFNPAGLAANTRVDGRGIDINRDFDSTSDPVMRNWRAWVQTLCPRAALCLHEDYDAQGCYVYELGHDREAMLAPCVMPKVDPIIAREPSGAVDGRAISDGMLWRPDVPPDVTGAEAIELYHLGCDTTLTFETPSEFSLDARILAHITFVQSTLELLLSPPPRH